jgi:hypothetical protein
VGSTSLKTTKLEIPPSLGALPAVMTSGQVCSLRQCAPGTLYRARKEGRLNPIAVNARVYLYPREEVLRWLGFGESQSIDAPVLSKKLPPRKKKEAGQDGRKWTEAQGYDRRSKAL